jgi:hypothetical protein
MNIKNEILFLLIKGKPVFTCTIDLSNFADGIYFVEVFNSSNERIKNIKLILSN